jgi:hypothetical protein
MNPQYLPARLKYVSSLLLLGLSIQTRAQSSSFGNLFVHAQGNVAIHNLHTFGNGAGIFKTAQLYPVPAHAELQVEWQANDKMTEKVFLIVHNVLGEIVFKQTVKNDKTLQINKIDVSKWTDGMYTLQLHSNKSISIAKTFVVYHN